MTETETAPPKGQEPAQQQSQPPKVVEQQPAEVPPWERDGVPFDPQRAWQRQQRIAEDLKQAQHERDKAKAKIAEHEQAQLSEQEKLQARLAEAETQREAARSEALRFRIAAEHGITPEDIDLLGTGTEDEMTAKAKRLVALYAAQQPPPTPGPPTPRRPVEQLRPGATPTDHQSEDDLLYQSLFGDPSKKAS